MTTTSTNLAMYLGWATEPLQDALAELDRQRPAGDVAEAILYGMRHAAIATALSLVQRVQDSLQP